MPEESTGGFRPLIKCNHAKFIKKNNNKIKMSETIRCYECENGHQFVEIVKKSESCCDFKCPECRLPLDAIMAGTTIGIIKNKEPTTLGQQSERNCRKLSKYKISEEKAIRDAQLKKSRTSWYNPDGKDLSFLNKMNQKEKEHYIMTGDTNGKG